MGKYDFIKIKKKLSKYLDEARFEHTMGVMYTCAALAMVYDYDLEDAQAAGLLHDSAKCIPNIKKLKLCSQHDIPVSDFEKSGQYPAGTVFIEGLVFHNQKWYLYYGCADSRVAVAVYDSFKK